MMAILPRDTAKSVPPVRQFRRAEFFFPWRFSLRWLCLGCAGAIGLSCAVVAQTTFPIGQPPVDVSRATPQGSSEDPESTRLRADAIAKRGQIGEALALVRRLPRADPASTQYRLMEAQYLGWLGRTATAGERYRRLMQANPSAAAAQEGSGKTKPWRGNRRAAQAAYANAICTSGADNVTAQLGPQRALVAAGRATPAYRQVVDLDRRFIPRWRLGVRTECFFSDELSANPSLMHLRFADQPVLQIGPGVTWQRHPQWSSHLRMHVMHDSPKGGKVNTGFAGLGSTTWQFTPLSSASLSYAMGEENASQLIKGLIGEKNFQSVGVI